MECNRLPYFMNSLSLSFSSRKEVEVEERAEFLREKNNFCIIKFGGYHLD